MVLINEKKFACATCIKGHRVSGCTHTDRPLFEVKKKGRPATQCQHCRDKRKTHTPTSSAVHTKCACGDPKPPNVLLPGAPEPSGTTGLAYPSNDPTSNSTPGPETPVDIETRKGQPGSKATFPNGLKDVHEMAAAAEALSTMNTEDAVKVAERKVANLLNPCHCTTGGPCRCCQPKRDRGDSLNTLSSTTGGAKTPTGGITEGLSEMFRSKASTSATTPESSCCGGSSKPSASSRPSLSVDPGQSGPTWAQLMTPRDNYLSPDNMHHPAHTSRFVHKTKLYSPYSTSGNSTPRHGSRREGSASAGPSSQSGWASSSSSSRPPPPRLRPLSDMNRFLGAMFREDGTVADEIPRSALGLPGIKTFDMIAESGGVKIEPMEVDMDVPISFPTNEDVVIGACTCGENCDCAGCATHGIPPRSGEHSHSHEGGCGDSCSSSFDCADHLSLPSGITSIGHLLSIAAANVPPPAQKRSNDLSNRAHDTRIMPPAVHINEDAARSLGFVTLKPLECCNGRCQCAPGKCTCEKECCGCCIRCACDEDGDTRMSRETTPAASVPMSKSCCSSDTPTPTPQSQPQPIASAQGSCCSSKSNEKSPSRSNTATPSVSSPSVTPHSGTSPLLSPDSAQAVSRQPSPLPAVSSTPNSHLRRSSSSSQAQTSTSSARRPTVSHGSAIHRSGSTGKQASKALALHTPVGHPQSGAQAHPRPILPKPSSATNLGTLKSAGGSRVPTPSHHGQASSLTDASPSFSTHQDVQGETSLHHEQFQLPDSALGYQTLSQPLLDSAVTNSTEMSLPEVNDDDFMAYINQLTASTDSSTGHGGLFAQASSSEGSLDQTLETPDLAFDGQQPFNMMDFTTSTAPGTGLDESITAGLEGMDQDFLAMLSDALGSGVDQSNVPSLPVLPSVPPVSIPQQISSQRPQSQQSMYGPPPSVPPPSHLMQNSQPQSRSTSVSQQPSRPNFTSAEDSGFAVGLADAFVHRSVEASRAAWAEPAPPVYHQLPPQYTAMLQHMLGNNPAFGVPQPTHETGDSNGGGTNSDAGRAMPTDNMIDLSKPLNSADVERILRALQDQQADPTSSANGQMPKSVLTPPVGPHQGGIQSASSRPPSNRQSLSEGTFNPSPSLPPQYQQPQQQGLGYSDLSANRFESPQELYHKYMLANTGIGQSTLNQSGTIGNGMGLDVNGLNHGGMAMHPPMGYPGHWSPNVGMPEGGDEINAEDQYGKWFQHLTTKSLGI